MNITERLLLENKAWVEENTARDADFLAHLREPRDCEVFWIGNSDSRVHADEITRSVPGELLVHRNLGNLVNEHDINLLGALDYAVNVAHVGHIIVCGHHESQAIRAAMRKPDPAAIYANKWLRPIRQLYQHNRQEVDRQPTDAERCARLVELNVVEQVYNLAHLDIIQRAWSNARSPLLHGWVYGLNDAVIKELIVLTADTRLDPLYRYDFE
jgi:carbonic anhydrase